MANSFFKMIVGVHVHLYRWTGGRIGSSVQGGKVLLLTTTGRKTGKTRTVPVMYIEDAAGNPVVAASFAGKPVHPAWFHNIQKNADVRYQIRDREVAAHAEVLPDAQRDALWKELTTRFPGFAEYEKRTTRVIPMVALHAS
jgi:deazaflavin-dependent oxidoreductase (nitroreductase family)